MAGQLCQWLSVLSVFHQVPGPELKIVPRRSMDVEIEPLQNVHSTIRDMRASNRMSAEKLRVIPIEYPFNHGFDFCFMIALNHRIGLLCRISVVQRTRASKSVFSFAPIICIWKFALCSFELFFVIFSPSWHQVLKNILRSSFLCFEPATSIPRRGIYFSRVLAKIVDPIGSVTIITTSITTLGEVLRFDKCNIRFRFLACGGRIF